MKKTMQEMKTKTKKVEKKKYFQLFQSLAPGHLIMLACLHPTSVDGNLKTPWQAATPATDNIMSAWQMIAYNMSRMWSVPMARNVLHAFLSSEIRDG